MRIVTLALGASIIAAAGLVPATAVGRQAAIGNVTVAWADGAHSAVRVSWTETTPAANTVRLRNSDGIVEDLAQAAAGEPNQVDVPRRVFGSTAKRELTSRVVVSAGAESASSATFDRYVPGGPVVMAFLPGGSMSFDLPASRRPDPTPRDPLDVAGLDRFTPSRILPGPGQDWDGCDVVYGPEVTSLPFVLPYPATSYLMYMYASNEWGDQTSFAEVMRSQVSISPHQPVDYGAGILARGGGSAISFMQSGSPPLCRADVRAVPKTFVLHARRDATAPWAAVRSGQVSANGSFVTVAGALGARQYRAVVPNQLVPPTGYADAASAAMYGSVSEVRAVLVRTRTLGARFLDPSVPYGARASAFLAVAPGGSQRALLQYRTANGLWRGLTYKTLASGRGTATFTWLHRGSTAFRWYVPASISPARLPVAASFTPAFPLTVR